MLRLENIKIRQDLENNEIMQIACKKYGIQTEEVIDYYIYKKSVDARNKEDIFYNFTLDVLVKNESKYRKIKVVSNEKDIRLDVIKKRKSSVKPVIVGAGPAGLFCALVLVNNGIKPIIVEQGKKVEERIKDVEEFINSGKLNVSSNIQFGEGGAGTFSDGKLTTGIHDSLCKVVIDEFVKFGAPEQIRYISKPHIGTDNLVKIVSNMRNYIIDNGGEFLFDEKVIDFEIYNDNIVKTSDDESNIQEFDKKEATINKKIKTVITTKRKIETDTVILAIGHSARDTFEMLHKKDVYMEKKNFSVGVRIEHKQSMINQSQYGAKTKLKLPVAEYKLAYHNKETRRSCYTFCMCPGGYVMASSSEEETIVTNGMSKFSRDAENANSAILVNVVPEDFKGESPLEGMYFQRELEHKAFILGGGNYFAPIQTVKDFLENKKTENIAKIKPTYLPGVKKSNLNEILPDFVADTLKEGIKYFDTKIKGFASDDAILTGVETRSSSPVKIVRKDDTLMSCSVNGLYPCGEGPGYAGGIMSAATDGIRCAIKIIENEK